MHSRRRPEASLERTSKLEYDQADSPRLLHEGPLKGRCSKRYNRVGRHGLTPRLASIQACSVLGPDTTLYKNTLRGLTTRSTRHADFVRSIMRPYNTCFWTARP